MVSVSRGYREAGAQAGEVEDTRAEAREQSLLIGNSFNGRHFHLWVPAFHLRRLPLTFLEIKDDFLSRKWF